jgi:PAS domain S-box-containing protein
LSQAGYDVIGTASSGAEAIKLAGDHNLDLILSDISIEGPMDGIEVSQIIATHTGAGIIYLSGHADLALLERAKLTEPFGYLVKPVKFRELISTVAMALYKKDVQSRLAGSEEQFRILYEDAPLAYLSLDPTLRIINSNKALSDLIGYAREDILRRGLGDFLPAEVVSALKRFLESQEVPERPFTVETEISGEDGAITVLELHARQTREGKDGAAVIHCILSDITERKRAAEALRRSEEFLRRANEELEWRVAERTAELVTANRKLQEEIETRKSIEVSLRESEERFRAIIDSSSDSMFVKDRSRRYIFVNAAMVEILGREAHDIIGKRAEDLFSEDAANHIREVDLRVLGGERIEEEHTRTIGTIDVTFLDTRFPLVLGGRIEGICGLSRNITDRKLRAGVQLPQEDDVISESMKSALSDALRAAKTDAIVLLTGESGTGKDWIAKYIHAHSGRSSGSFFSLNCAALPPELAESELFGHEAGAFTGAGGRKKGLLELTEGGTLLLNEIGDMDLRLQAKLLTFLDSRSFTRVGGEKEIRINARLLAATNRDLEIEVEQGRFRKDLYFRLNVLAVHVPPLRERIEDIPLLTRNLLQTIAADLQLSVVPWIEPRIMAALKAYHWPGNVRELRNVLERAAIRSGGGPMDLAGLALIHTEDNDSQRAFPIPKGKGLNEMVRDLKSWMMEDALKRCAGNKSQAARMLGVSRLSVINYLKGS